MPVSPSKRSRIGKENERPLGTLASRSTDHRPTNPAQLLTPNVPTVSLTSTLTVYERLRVTYNLRTTAKSSIATSGGFHGKPKMADDSLDPELDNLINAEFRNHRCYRIPIMSFYENDRIGASFVLTKEGVPIEL